MSKPKKTNEIEQIVKERDANLAGWKRSLADFENFKKQVEKEKELFVQLVRADSIGKLLPIMNSWEMAMKAVPQDQKDSEWATKCPELVEWIKGVVAIKNQLEDFFKKEGIIKIETVGQEFDPTLHEAMLEEETDGEGGIILDEFEPGYSLGGRVIKYPKVKVSKKK